MSKYEGKVKVDREELHRYTHEVSNAQGTFCCNLTAMDFLLRKEQEEGLAEKFNFLAEEIRKLKGDARIEAWVLQCANGIKEDIEQVLWIIHHLAAEALKEADELDEVDVHFGHNLIKLEEAQGCPPLI
jgi:hypothetical protein